MGSNSPSCAAAAGGPAAGKAAAAAGADQSKGAAEGAGGAAAAGAAGGAADSKFSMEEQTKNDAGLVVSGMLTPEQLTKLFTTFKVGGRGGEGEAREGGAMVGAGKFGGAACAHPAVLLSLLLMGGCGGCRSAWRRTSSRRA